MNKLKREKQSNFTAFEEKLLVKQVLKNGSIVENKNIYIIYDRRNCNMLLVIAWVIFTCQWTNCEYD